MISLVSQDLPLFSSVLFLVALDVEARSIQSLRKPSSAFSFWRGADVTDQTGTRRQTERFIWEDLSPATH